MTNSAADTTKIERAVLQSVLKTLDAKPLNLARKRLFGLCLVAAVAAGFAISWLDLAFFSHPVIRAVEPLFALALGAVTTYAVLRAVSKARWSFLGQYVDRAAVEARLRELGAYQCVQAESASLRKTHGRKSLPCVSLHYAARLNLGVRCHGKFARAIS